MLKNLATGKAGELRVASELLLRGYEVSMSLVDSGSDLVLANGKKIQVKTGRNHIFQMQGYTCSQYTFSFQRQNRNGIIRQANWDEVDFVIFWAIDDNAFYIVPIEIIKGKKCVKFTITDKPKRPSPVIKYQDKWELLNN